MSIFDPQQIYYHSQKSTRKGQVLQQKPQKKISAINEDMVPNAINILKTYGYTIYKNPPDFNDIQYFFPFSIQLHWEEPNHLYDLSTSTIFDFILLNVDSFRQFINRYNNPNLHAKILIAISSMLFNYIGGEQSSYTFQCEIKINGIRDQYIEIGNPGRTDGILLLGSASRDSFSYEYDWDINASAHQYHTAQYHKIIRTQPIPYDNAINYAYSEDNNLWSSIVNSGVLPLSFQYSLNTTSFGLGSQYYSLTDCKYCGYMGILLS